ncbi:SEC-C motif-containing protein [Sediminihabitans luteus]|uniref:UPF0225 protein CLV28_2974 n=1 Tax=Sediminihabitans luteus TaxID=1138585 RepID=A0A2M9CC25_9CELL|nr:YchJ family metal-binding protein [Sediminihabitans luteus]PJJ68558.1 SEC-C motif-containing protein [Sediminihabitans luteus]GII99893.1 UPF0225 protein [Sediminihabitans luteus]
MSTPGPTHPATSDHCPCLSGDTYGDCCARFHAGAPAPTAEQLMRSRYSAFAARDSAYVLTTWHPSARPASLDLVDDVEWRGLEVVRTRAGGPLDTTGVVEFVARYRERTARPDGPRAPVHELHEVSRFVREDGRWYYVAGDHPA